MNYKEALDLILKARGHGNKKNHLAEVKKTARALNLLPLKFKTIHIAGTNGKGTVSTLMADTLSNAGFKTGLFTSPHINCATERIKINGLNIPEKDFARMVDIVLAKETVPLKFFEVLTLAAFLYLTEQKVDYAVIECGIGGRMDCTNIIEPVLNIITSVDIDHSNILGSGIAEIAWQKGGIIKKNTPCIIGKLKKAALGVIREIAEEEKAPLLSTDKNFKFLNFDFKKLTSNFVYKGRTFSLKLIGLAQARNAALVCCAAEVLNINLDNCAKAFRNITMPLRFDVSRLGKKHIIADGAHNPAALAEFIKNYKLSPYYKNSNTLIYAAMQDKDYKKAAKILSSHFDNIILTRADETKGVPTEILGKYFKSINVKNIERPSEIVLKNLEGDIIILGSFYLRQTISFFSC